MTPPNTLIDARRAGPEEIIKGLLRKPSSPTLLPKGEGRKTQISNRSVSVKSNRGQACDFAIRSAHEVSSRRDEMFIASYGSKLLSPSEVATPLPRGDVLSKDASRYKHSAPLERRRHDWAPPGTQTMWN